MSLMRVDPCTDRFQFPTYDFFGLDLLDTSLVTPRTRGGLEKFDNTPMFDLDVRECDGEYTVTADLPGMVKNDITVTLDKGVLNVSAQREDNREETKNGKYTFRERRYGKFSRSVQLDGAADEGVNAKYVDGVLTVTVPRNGRETRRTIEIQ